MQGVWTALWTPIDDQGRLLREQVKKHLAFLLDRGIDGIACAGSTGQFLYLDVELRQELLQLVVEQVGPERTIVNLSDPNPQNVKKLAHHAAQLQVRAVMLLPQIYFPVAQEDIIAYFIQMAKIANRPLILYNYPECAKNLIAIETLDAISKTVPVAGIKQSGSDFAYHTHLVELGRKNGFSVLTGAEIRLVEALSLGVRGCIGGLSNAIPELIVQVYKGYQQKADTKAIEAKISELHTLIAPLAFPLNISALMEARGLFPGSIKEILSPTTLAKYKSLSRIRI